MSTTVVNSDTSDRRLASYTLTGESYEAVRTGTASHLDVDGSGYVGQDTDGATFIGCNELFLNFDLLAAGVPATATVTAVALALYCVSGGTTTNFLLDFGVQNWGASVDAGDWYVGEPFTPLYTWDSAGLVVSAYNTMTVVGGGGAVTAAQSALAGDGVLRLSGISQNQVNDLAPSNSQYVQFRLSDEAAGNRPQLTVTYTLPPILPNYLSVRQAARRAASW